MWRKLRRILIIALITPIALVVLLALVFFANNSFQKPPYSLPNSPIVAYRITGEEHDVSLFVDDPNSFHGYAIVQQREIADPQLQRDIINLLHSRLTYGIEGMACFEPGIAIRLGQGPNQIDVLTCLTCQHIYFYRNGQLTYRDISRIGIARIKAIYGRLFPGHSVDGNDADMQRISAIRDQERDKREQTMIDASTQPAKKIPPSSLP